MPLRLEPVEMVGESTVVVEEEHVPRRRSEAKVEGEQLIPGLPNEVAEHCLLHLPFPYQPLAHSVSSALESHPLQQPALPSSAAQRRRLSSGRFRTCSSSPSIAPPFGFSGRHSTRGRPAEAYGTENCLRVATSSPRATCLAVCPSAMAASCCTRLLAKRRRGGRRWRREVEEGEVTTDENRVSQGFRRGNEALLGNHRLPKPNKVLNDNFGWITKHGKFLRLKELKENCKRDLEKISLVPSEK